MQKCAILNADDSLYMGNFTFFRPRMMRSALVRSFWRVLSVEHLDRKLFLVFLLTIPFSVRKVVWFVPLRGAFNEYADVSITLSDVVLTSVFLALGWMTARRKTTIQDHRILSKSSVGVCLRQSFWESVAYAYARKNGVLYGCLVLLPGGAILVAILTSYLSTEPRVAWYGILKWVEMYGLFVYVVFRVAPRETDFLQNGVRERFFGQMMGILAWVGCGEALWGLMHVIAQRSFGLRFLGESVLASDLPGVAKVLVNGNQVLRAYGSFPHPNILGGFLVITLLCTMVWWNMFHVKRTSWLVFGMISLQVFGLAATFSKSAWVGFGMAMMLVAVQTGVAAKSILSMYRGVSYAEWRRRKWDGAWMRRIVVASVIFGALLTISSRQAFERETFLWKSLRERGVYHESAMRIIQEKPFFGVGYGQFVIFVENKVSPSLLDWQLQPVHNVFLLIWAELGAIGFCVMTLWYGLWTSFSFGKGYSGSMHAVSCGESMLRAMPIALLPALMMDHYLWDIQQGQLLFWLTAGCCIGYILHHKLEEK
jgi:O-antigen ligase